MEAYNVINLHYKLPYTLSLPYQYAKLRLAWIVVEYRYKSL